MRRALHIFSLLGLQASLLVLQASEALAAKTSHDAHGAEGGNAGLPQLDPEWFASQIFWLAVTFGLLYVTFAKKILPELSSIIDTRREHINNDLSAAENFKEEAESVQAAYEEALLDARNTSADMFTAAEQKIKDTTAEKQAAFYERAKDEIRETEVSIAKATAQAMDEMTTIAAEISAEAAEKIIGVRTGVAQAKDVVKNINKKAA